jgi:hypothetical protein
MPSRVAVGGHSAVAEDSQAQQTAGLHGSRQTHLGDFRVNVLGAQLPLTLGVEQAARIVGVGRSSMYAAIKRGDIQPLGSVGGLSGGQVVGVSSTW